MIEHKQKTVRIRPKKHLGQHFLVSQGHLDNIVSALSPVPGEIVVEIGAGRGDLTARLLAAGLRVRAIEIDQDLAGELDGRFGGDDFFTLLHTDARSIDYSMFGGSFKVAGNLPYQSATYITSRLLDYLDRISLMVLTYQREVARRITAAPGSRSYGYLSCLAQYHCRVEYIMTIPPGAFRPAPKVQSGVVRFKPRPPEWGLTRSQEDRLFRVIKGVFSQRRKTIANALAGSGCWMASRDDLKKKLNDSGFDPSRRPETFSLVEFISLCRLLAANKTGRPRDKGPDDAGQNKEGA